MWTDSAARVDPSARYDLWSVSRVTDLLLGCETIETLDLSFSCEVIQSDSKPVKVPLDFHEEDLPFSCNWPERLREPWPAGSRPEKPSEKLQQIKTFMRESRLWSPDLTLKHLLFF